MDVKGVIYEQIRNSHELMDKNMGEIFQRRMKVNPWLFDEYLEGGRNNIGWKNFFKGNNTEKMLVKC